MTIEWAFGEAWVREAVGAWAGGGDEHVVRDNVRRRIVRIDGCNGPLLVKQFRVTSGRHPLRERFKAAIGRSPAEKEAHALRAAAAAGAPVVEPLALGTLADGDRILVLPWLEATPAGEALATCSAGLRPALLERLGEAVRALHQAGFSHGDLHLGNALVAADGAPILWIDLQSARSGASDEAKLRDVATLVYGLRRDADDAERALVGRVALGREGGDALRDAVADHAHDHARGRTRRALVAGAGRRFAHFSCADGSGIRSQDIEAAHLRRWLELHRRACAGEASTEARSLKQEGPIAISTVASHGRRVLVKERRADGLRALADLVRGSAGRRAWTAGHGLLARDIPAALPLAFVERRMLGVPVSSIVVLEWIEGPDGVAACEDPAARADQLELMVKLHRRHVDHGDLKASNWIHRAPDGPATLIDLEGVAFPRRLSDDRRIEALAQWNASLPDTVTAEARTRALSEYCERTGAQSDLSKIREAVARRSLARQHRWTGADCECARGAADGER